MYSNNVILLHIMTLFDMFSQLLPSFPCDMHLEGMKDEPMLLICKKVGWTVTLKHSGGQFRLGKGWRDFVIGNNVVRHDALLFKLQRGDGIPTYKVYVFKA